MLGDQHKSHSFTSLEDIYQLKKESIVKLSEDLSDLTKFCQKLLTESNSNIDKSEENLCKTIEQFRERIKLWEEDFRSRFLSHLDSQKEIKAKIEELLVETKNQKLKVIDLLEHPHKEKLVRSFTEIVESTNNVLVKQGDMKVSSVIEGDSLENHFIPKFTTTELKIEGINKDTVENKYFYAPSFHVVKDIFKLGAKVIPNKKQKTVVISLRISKPNLIRKQYEVQLFVKSSMEMLGQYILNCEKDSKDETHILHKVQMNAR